MSAIPEMRRPLPRFQQWLDDRGALRGEGFAALEDLMLRSQGKPPTTLTANEQAFLRMWQGMLVAVVELCNIEDSAGTPHEQIIALFPRVLAASAMYAAASVLRDDAPYRVIAKLITEEFRHAAKVAADQLAGDRA